ncbi:unnamed protein product, partial [Schistocephalus solidus]|uniref:DNA mismatch repair protein n=1 Tax=Schistocephalus solidus TaxID=70667 RepID=A0A183SJJ3_SCHSO
TYFFQPDWSYIATNTQNAPSPHNSPVRCIKTTENVPNNRTLSISRSFSRDSPKTSASLCTSFDEDASKGKDCDVETSFLDTSNRNDSFALDETIEGDFEGNWPHLSLPFLHPDRIKDLNGHRPNHPEYDPRTLFVPDDYIVGKFYELYHQDAVIAAEELRLSYMKGKFAHTGFPETAFEKMANQLLHKGYKVARVEQTETPEGMSKRTGGRPGCEKVVRREICQIVTPGTWFASLRGGISDSTSGADAEEERMNCSLNESFSSYQQPLSRLDAEASLSRHLLVILEDRCAKDGDSPNNFGVAILKTVTGEIMIGQFSDDVHLSRMCTVLAHYPPAQILLERGNPSQKLKTILKSRLPDVPLENLTPKKQFFTASETLEILNSANYFALGAAPKDHSEAEIESAQKRAHWPGELLKMLDPFDPLGRTPLNNYELAIRCLGAVIFYLKYCLADTEILSLGLIKEYQPPDAVSAMPGLSHQPFYERQINMPARTAGSSFILSSHSSIGRRLMRSWVVNPPCHPAIITRRQDAIEELMLLAPQLQGVREGLRRLPDLERLLTKVHIMSYNATSPDHPESRAVLFEEGTYSRRKILDFLCTLSGFKATQRLVSTFASLSVRSEYLRSLTTLKSEGGAFPCCKERLAAFELAISTQCLFTKPSSLVCIHPWISRTLQFATLTETAFDHEKARSEGRIVVEPGFDPEFDTARQNLDDVKEQLDDYLHEQSRIIGAQLTYTGTGKNRFQIEVPDTHTRNVPDHWEVTSQRKGYRRYRSPEVVRLFAKLVTAEDAKEESMQGIMRRLFASFAVNHADWHTVVKCTAELDCLMSLANYSSTAAATTCRPEFFTLDSGSQKPFLEMVSGSHPCLLRSFSGDDITPNDLRLGAVPGWKEQPTDGFKPGITSLLITGPNMGGKSTLMRQTALLAILAHLVSGCVRFPCDRSGCHIPAVRFRLTPIDRIFTRIGASDRLISGQSTFYVELAETAIIVRHASPHSLALIDELGRGTSTRDGSSLAAAVLRYISTPRNGLPGPLTLFSTHYHSLTDSLQDLNVADQQTVDVGHMVSPSAVCLTTSFPSYVPPQTTTTISASDRELCTNLLEFSTQACLTDGGQSGKEGNESQRITFLYKLVPSACPKSYGFNVAHLANIPEEASYFRAGEFPVFKIPLLAKFCVLIDLLLHVDIFCL